MAITERLMASGQWDIALNPQTPRSIRDVLGMYGHVYIFLTRQVPGQSDAAMIASAIWGGWLRNRPTSWELVGVNMIAWLGDENDKGKIYEAQVNNAAFTFGQSITNLINNASGAIHLGAITAGGATKTLPYQWVDPRQAIDHVCSVFGNEYRVNKDGTIDAGPSSALFVTTPTAAAMLRSSGRSDGITGISVTQLDVQTDIEDYVTRAIVHDGTGAYTGNTGSATSYKDLYGNLVVFSKIYEEPNTTAAEAAGHAATLVAGAKVLRRQVKLASDEYAVTRDVNVGDWIWIYDEDGGVVDTANPVRYRGTIIYPMKIRVMGITWPVEQGMGVWYRSVDGVWTDLTNYVLFEPPGATFEVGAPSRAVVTTAAVRASLGTP